MTRPAFTIATPADALELADNLRPPDALELALSTAGLHPRQACLHCLACSDATFAARIDGRLVCLFGASALSLLNRSATLWLVGTREVETSYRTFARWSRRGLAMAAQTVPWAVTFHNAVHAEHRTAVRWLAWLGASFGPSFTAPPLDPSAQPALFLPFTIERSALCP